MSETGETTDVDAIGFDYSAKLSALVFRPEAIPLDDLAQRTLWREDQARQCAVGAV